MGADFDLLRGGGDRLWGLLGLALAAARVVAMLLPSMRLATDGTPEAGSAHKVGVPPFAAVLAEGDTGVAGGRPNEARPTEDVDGLVVQGLRAGPSLGVPDVEVDGHRCGGLRLGVDHPGTGGRNIVLTQGRSLEGTVDVRVDRKVTPTLYFGTPCIAR